MITPKISGIFDVREYDGKTKEHSARKMKDDNANVSFSAIFLATELPECFKIAGKPDELLRARSTRKEKQAAEAEGRDPILDALAATFKIGAGTKWFDKHAKPCDRPTNAELEAGRWMVQIDFTRREKDPANPLKPSGYWVNCIMVTKIEENPFDGQAFEEAPEADEEKPENAEQAGAKKDDLPF